MLKTIENKKSLLKKAVPAMIILTMIILLTSCMPGPNDMRNAIDQEGKPAGFWMGLWHGLIAFISFIVSLFNPNVNVYEVYNNGGWYNFGFILGIMMAFGSGGAGSRTAYCRKKKVKIEDID